MIRSKNLGHDVLSFTLAGALTTSNSVSAMAKFDGFLSNMYAKVVSGTLAVTFDVFKNGVSIFATRPRLGTGGTISSTGAITTTGTPTQVLAGDIFSISITDVGAGAPLDFCAFLTVSKYNPAGIDKQSNHDNVV